MEYLNIEAEVANANAWNGIQLGMPAITAFMGFMHALQRKVAQKIPCKFSGLAIGVREYAMREYENDKGYHYLNLPLPGDIPGEGTKIDRHIMNQAYIDLSLNLILRVQYDSLHSRKEFLRAVEKYMYNVRIAGGNISRFAVKLLKEGEIPPAFYIRDCTEEMMTYPGDDILSKMLAALEDKAHRYSVIANGFRAISDLGHVEGQRDADTLHAFAEQTYTIAEYIPAKAIQDIEALMFAYDHTGVSYLCTQNFGERTEPA